MTVAIGFHCKDGIVLAADTELSTLTVKYNGSKAWLYKYPKDASQFVLQVGIVGAGDAAFIQYASERIDAELDAHVAKRGRLTMPEVNSVIQGVINDIHHTHLYPVGSMNERPTIDLMIGIWIRNEPDGARNRLAKTSLTAVTKVWNYEAVGIGSDLANFIIKRFYGGRISVTQAVFVATQVLMHAKEHVPRCGGDSDVIVMYLNGLCGKVQQETIEKSERFLKDFEKAIEPVLFDGADQGVTNEAFSQRVDVLSSALKQVRSQTFLEKQAEQVRQDITIHVPTGNLTVVGEWISPAITAGDIPGTSVPASPTTPSRRRKKKADRLVRQGSTHGRKVRLPSRG